MIYSFEILNVRPLLSNHATKVATNRGHIRKYKTDEAKQFTQLMHYHLNSMKNKLIDISKTYNEKEHYLMVDFEFHIPLFTKTGSISKKSGDWDGFIKYTQDCIFDFLGIDDSQIIGGSSIKIHSEQYKIKVIIKICNLIDLKFCT